MCMVVRGRRCGDRSCSRDIFCYEWNQDLDRDVATLAYLL